MGTLIFQRMSKKNMGLKTQVHFYDNTALLVSKTPLLLSLQMMVTAM